MLRECSSRKKFYPNSSIRPIHLDEDVNLIEIKSWIINFKNYIKQGYSDEVPEKRTLHSDATTSRQFVDNFLR